MEETIGCHIKLDKRRIGNCQQVSRNLLRLGKGKVGFIGELKMKWMQGKIIYPRYYL